MKSYKSIISIIFLIVFGMFSSCYAIVDNNNAETQKPKIKKTKTKKAKKSIVKESDVQDKKYIDSKEIIKGTILDLDMQSEANFDEKIEENKTPYTNDVASDFSLEDCIKIAVEYNPIIRSSVYNALMYKTKIVQAWANYFPSLSVGIDGAYSGNNASGENAGLSYNQAEGVLPNLSANMLLFDFGKTKATADAASRTYESKAMQTKEDVNQLIYNIKIAYNNVLFSQVQVKVYEDTVRDYDLQQKRALRFYQIGKKAKVDVITADYNLGQARLDLVKVKNTLDVAYVTLAKIMGIPDYHNYKLITELSANKFDITEEKALLTAYNLRPELEVAKKEVEAAKLNLRAKQRDYAPNIDLFGSYGNTIGSRYGLASYRVGVDLKYSNLNILKVKKIVDEASMNYQKSLANLDNVKHDLHLKVKTAYLDLKTSEEAIQIAKLALDEATEQYRQVSGRYQAGVGDIIELKDGETTYLNARLNFYKSLLEYNNAAANLEKEIGAPLIPTEEKVLKNFL